MCTEVTGTRTKFQEEYHVVNNSEDYPDPVSDHDVSLLEQMGVEVAVDRQLRTVTILGKRTNPKRRALNARKRRFAERWMP
jgi:hypothetical protein